MPQIKITGNRWLFNDAMNYDRISKMGNTLEGILEVIEFEIFRGTIRDSSYEKRQEEQWRSKALWCGNGVLNKT